MAVIKTRTSNRIAFTFYVIQDIGPEGTEFAYDISDDGWKIWVRKPDGTGVDVIHTQDENRLPDKASASRLLAEWAVNRWGAENTDAHIPSE